MFNFNKDAKQDCPLATLLNNSSALASNVGDALEALTAEDEAAVPGSRANIATVRNNLAVIIGDLKVVLGKRAEAEKAKAEAPVPPADEATGVADQTPPTPDADQNSTVAPEAGQDADQGTDPATDQPQA